MMKTILTAAAAFVALGSAAHAQGYANFGLGHTFGDIEVPTGVLRAGVDLNPNFSLEAEGQLGLGSDTAAATEFEIDHIIGGFARLSAPVSRNAFVFGRLGYYFSEAETSTGGITISADDDDFAAGAGVQVNLRGSTGLRFDYTNFGFDEDAHQATASLVFNF